MKKARKTTSTSPKKKENKAMLLEDGEAGPRPSVVVPLISKREAEPEFIERVSVEPGEVNLLLVVDTDAMPGQFGFATSEIAHGNELMQEIKESAKLKGKECIDIIEWGNTETKILHFIQLKGINKVLLVKQDNQFFKKLVEQLREQTSAELEIVK